MLFKSEEQSIVFSFLFLCYVEQQCFLEMKDLKRSQLSNVTQDEKDPEIFISSNTVFFSRVQKKI